MLIRFFRASFAIQYAAVLLMALILWLPSFVGDEVQVYSENLSDLQPFYQWTIGLLSALPLLVKLLAFALLVFQSFFFNAIMAANQLITRVSSVGAFVYVLLMSQAVDQTQLYPFLIASFFVLAALHTVFLVYDADRADVYIFNAGFFVALASLFYFPAALLLIWLWITMFIARQSDMRSWIIPFVGFLAPYFFVFSYYFLTDQLMQRMLAYKEIPQLINMPSLELQPIQLAIWAIIGVLLFTTYSYVWGNSAEKNVGLRKKIAMTTSLLFFALPSLLFSPVKLIQNGILIIPFAVFLSFTFAYTRSAKWQNLLLLLLMLLSVMNHYLPLFF